MSKTQDDDFIQGRDYAEYHGHTSYREFVKISSHLSVRKRAILKPWNGEVSKKKVKARVDFERWVADCPAPTCGGAEVVDLADPIFFCCSCGNPEIKGKAYTVTFPDKKKRAEIYGELNQRPLVRPKGQGRVRTAETSKPLYPGLGRSWHYEEGVKELGHQRKNVRSAYPELKPVEKEYQTPPLPMSAADKKRLKVVKVRRK